MGLSHDVSQRGAVETTVREFLDRHKAVIVDHPELRFSADGSMIGITTRVRDADSANQLNAELRQGLIDAGIRWDAPEDPIAMRKV